jgi:hypothetical protein
MIQGDMEGLHARFSRRPSIAMHALPWRNRPKRESASRLLIGVLDDLLSFGSPFLFFSALDRP